MFELEAECDKLATLILEREPCSDDPVLFRKYRNDLSREIEKTVRKWFDTPDDAVQGE